MLKIQSLNRFFVKAAVFAALSFSSLSLHGETNVSPLIDAAKEWQKNTELVILHPEGSLANILPVADAFTKLTGVNVKFVQTPVDDVITKMLLSAAQHRSDYDIALPATFGIPDLVEAGALLDLSPYAAKYEPLVDYSPSLYELGDSYKGKKFGYQTDGDTYVMFYNKLWLEDPAEQKRFMQEYGRPMRVPDTWEQLDELMAFFHRPEQGRYGGCLFRTPRYMVWEWWIRFHAKGALPVDDDMHPAIADQSGIDALTEMIEATQYLHPSADTNGLFDNWKEYAKGQCLANIGWGGTQKYLNGEQSQVRGELIHAPTPQTSYFNWGWNYVVSRYTKTPELAYLFTLFATMPEMSLAAVREDGFFDPYRSEHYTDEKIIEIYTSSFLDAHRKTMAQAIPDFYLESQGRYIQALQEGIVAAYKGDISPREALEYVAIRWEEITEVVGRDEQISQWKKIKQKYPKYTKN